MYRWSDFGAERPTLCAIRRGSGRPATHACYIARMSRSRRRPPQWHVATTLAISLCVAGCPLVAGLDELPERSSPPQTSAGCARLSRHKAGNDGVLLDLVNLDSVGKTCVWVDDVEVTVARYQIFSRAEKPIERRECDWKKTHSKLDDSNDCIRRIPGKQPDPLDPDKPARCVDWCDAADYCLAQGRRLCYGNWDHTLVPRDKPDEWALACSINNTIGIPILAGTVESECVTSQPPDGTCLGGISQCGPRSVGSPKGCRPAPDYPADLAGNVREWIDHCGAEGGQSALCRVRGGGYSDSVQAASCISIATAPRDATDARTGFRCCADLAVDEQIAVRE